MLYHGSKAGAFDLKAIVLECLIAMRRAGMAKTLIIHSVILVNLIVSKCSKLMKLQAIET